MKLLGAFLFAGLSTLPANAQSDRILFAEDCVQISPTFHMCDDDQIWRSVELPEELHGVVAELDNDITGSVEIMESPFVGIQVLAQRYTEKSGADFIAESLTKIDGFPAITYVMHTSIDGKDAVQAVTELHLYRLSLSASTFEFGDEYTPEHAIQHAGVLEALTHEWSLE